jgi:hypothetical protein
MNTKIKSVTKKFYRIISLNDQYSFLKVYLFCANIIRLPVISFNIRKVPKSLKIFPVSRKEFTTRKPFQHIYIQKKPGP